MTLVVIPAVGSQDFQGMGRYLLGAFPAFAVLGSLLADTAGGPSPGAPRVGRGASSCSPGMFANGRYIS